MHAEKVKAIQSRNTLTGNIETLEGDLANSVATHEVSCHGAYHERRRAKVCGNPRTGEKKPSRMQRKRGSLKSLQLG